MSSSQALSCRSRRLAASFSVPAVLTAASVLLGWRVHSTLLTAWLGGRTPMTYNTAASVIAPGIALLMAGEGKRHASRALILLASVLPFLTLCQYVAGVSLGIDELLMNAGTGVDFPGRIAPNTVLCLLLLSVGAAGLSWNRGSRFRTLAVPLLVSVALGVAAVSFAGYVTGFITFGWGRFVPMALPTSVALTLLSLAALAQSWIDESAPNGGRQSRFWEW